MMNKRGSSHADWAISLGIFLLYILSMLMLIQPGVQPFYKEDELLNIVTENYKESTSFMFYKTPIVIDTTGKDFAGPGDYKVQVNMQMPFSADVNGYAIINSNGDKIPFYIQEGWVSFSFDAPITNTDPATNNKFYIISNKLADGSFATYQRPAQSLTTVLVNDINFTLTIGSTETLQGVSDELLQRDVKEETLSPGVYCQDADLEEQENKYVMLKRMWGFPSSKDFMILYADTASAQYKPADFDAVPAETAGNIHPVCRQELPYEQASVVVEEWATRMFVPNAGGEYVGVTEPIRMVARVW